MKTDDGKWSVGWTRGKPTCVTVACDRKSQELSAEQAWNIASDLEKKLSALADETIPLSEGSDARMLGLDKLERHLAWWLVAQLRAGAREIQGRFLPTKRELDELEGYTKACTLYSQIGGFQTWVMAASTLYVTLTAGVWAVILDKKIAAAPKVVLCALHLIASVWLTGIFYGSLRSIRARFEMFDKLGTTYFPTILLTGRSSFTERDSKIFPRMTKKIRTPMTSGKHGEIQRFFYLLPFAGVLGTVYLLIDKL